ncbi:MAG: hypothetical protein HYW69_01225 [Candidatus Nealsonbacteria bacterium]|nr:hypothetical protein [Candidatus Nealsonbacteria bacterium]
MNSKSILVIFGKESPEPGSFDKVLSGKELEDLMGQGSVQEAYQLFCQLPKITDITYKGYELWWIHHDDIYYQFCLPYTQLRGLLDYLKDFKEVHLYQPPNSELFRYFLEAHGCSCFIRKKKRFLPPFGLLLQLFLSFIFLFWLKAARPKLLLETSDRFSQLSDFDFRYEFIYRELREKKIHFAEFIRSLEPWPVLLKHAWRRKRPVIYSSAIVDSMHFLAGLFGKRKFSADGGSEKRFWLSVSAHYLSNIRGTIWSIEAMKLIWQWIGAKSAIVPTACNRNFHEVLGCKLAGIKTTGIMHGASTKYYLISDFMPGFNGKKMLSVDQYGLWSDWWKSYYIKNSNAYKPEQLYVSGPMRPLAKEIGEVRPLQDWRGLTSPISSPRSSPRVLFISEGLADPREVIHYLSALLGEKDLQFFIKFRPHKDAFEIWLKDNQPGVYKKIKEETKIFRKTMEEAVSQSDVVVGSHSTAVLESLLQLKPFVFFRTKKWGDYFGIKSFEGQNCLFAENPIELINCIKNSIEIPEEYLKQLQGNFFGDPYKNGSKWAVEQAIKNYESS